MIFGLKISLETYWRQCQDFRLELVHIMSQRNNFDISCESAKQTYLFSYQIHISPARRQTERTERVLQVVLAKLLNKACST